METSYLIQRLKKPFKSTVNEKGNLLQQLDNAFAFGGGLKNGGLTKEAMDLLRPIFRFDYMGSAEFEFGAVPQTLAKIVEGIVAKEYYHFKIPVQYKHKSWKTGKEETGTTTISVICKKADATEVTARIKQFAKKDFNGTKEMVNLNSALARDEYSKDLGGWLELDNSYMFFSDEEMAEKVINLFFNKKGE